MLRPTSGQSPEPEELRVFKLQRDGELRQAGLVLVDSARVVTRLLKTELAIKSLLAPPEFIAAHKELLASHQGIRIHPSEAGLSSQITGHRIHGGVIALAQRPQDTPLEALGDKIVFLGGVNNSENVGAIIRNGLAFGANSMVVDPQSCSPYVRRAIRVSMGAVFKTKVHHCTSGVETLKQLRELGYRIFAASTRQGSRELSSVAIPHKAVLIIGCEGHGISAELEQAAHEAVHIGMADGIDSLNAAVASGIFLHKMSVRGLS